MLKRLSCWVLFTVLLTGTLVAQNDSITLVNARWQADTVEGMVLKTVHFQQKEYFHSNQFLAILEIPASSGRKLCFAYEPVRAKTSEIAEKHHAIAAVNGSFFDMNRHYPICHLRIDSVDVGFNEPGKDTLNRKYYQYGTLVLDSGRAQILHTDSARLWECCLPYRDIMTAGPLLIYKGIAQPMRNDLSFVYKRHNRTAIGIRPDGTVLLLVVDGRFRESEGMSLGELISTLRWLGCGDALNLDGGGSTTLYVRNRPHGGVVNHPSDNGRYDYFGERTVSNVILIH